MRYIFLALIFSFSILYADFLDDDMDGVENSYDKCPNTPFFELVDKYGCTVKKLKLKTSAKYSILFGYFYATDDIKQKSYFMDLSFYYKNISGYIESSRYSIDTESGQDDSTIALFYHYKNIVKYTFGAGAYLPTDNQADNKTDYFTSLKLSYTIDNYDVYISYKKTFMKDPQTVDTNTYTTGLGYTVNNKLYTSVSYQQNNSIYEKDLTLKYLSFYMDYYLKNNLYISTSYSKALNTQSIDKSYSLSLGYDF